MFAMKNKIVLIEDDKILSGTLSGGLRDAGFEVGVATNGEEGLSLVMNRKPDLILLDLYLPNKSGFAVLGALKAAPGTRDIPVMILTMLDSPGDIKMGLDLGAVDYMVKSDFSISDIIKKIQDFLVKKG